MAEKILIVDDDVDSLKLIGLMLQRHGYSVVAASAGSQALSKVSQEDPNLIILDVMMPDMNGYEVCRRLRANPKTQSIPIIMFTAKTLVDDKVAGFEAGADDYLTKPTHPAELASRVRAILARGGAQIAALPVQTESATIGVLGTKGGVGTSTLALNLGVLMAKAKHHPIVADFRLGSGSLGLFLGIKAENALARLLRTPADKIDREAVESRLRAHESGLRLLLSSTNPEEAQVRYTTESAFAVIQRLTAIGEPILLDLGAGLTPSNLHLLRRMDQIVLVVEPIPITLAMARQILDEFDKMTLGDPGRIHIALVNRSQSSVQTSWQDAEQILGREMRALISAAPELAYQAVASGKPMVSFQANAIVTGQIKKLADALLEREKQPQP